MDLSSLTISSGGKDDLGAFKVYTPGICPICKEEVGAIVSYNTVSLKRGLKDIDRSKTLLRDEPACEVNCGCYAKFHRQVAHIRDKMSKRK